MKKKTTKKKHSLLPFGEDLTSDPTSTTSQTTDRRPASARRKQRGDRRDFPHFRKKVGIDQMNTHNDIKVPCCILYVVITPDKKFKCSLCES